VAEPHLNHPGDLTWLPGFRPVEMLGPCPHDCSHQWLRVIADGPDFEHYTLDVCDSPDGCAGRCRGWLAEYPLAERRQGKPAYRIHGFRQVAVASPIE
jgi:hypothetical protein